MSPTQASKRLFDAIDECEDTARRALDALEQLIDRLEDLSHELSISELSDDPSDWDESDEDDDEAA